jgi:hypothetical protein
MYLTRREKEAIMAAIAGAVLFGGDDVGPGCGKDRVHHAPGALHSWARAQTHFIEFHCIAVIYLDCAERSMVP